MQEYLLSCVEGLGCMKLQISFFLFFGESFIENVGFILTVEPFSLSVE
jgi:hypothetical protein